MAKIQKYICTDCKHVGKAKKVKRGSRKTEIFWWVVFSPIAIIYSLYRFTGSKKSCEECLERTWFRSACWRASEVEKLVQQLASQEKLNKKLE